MKGVIHYKNSPYYWIRYYDAYESISYKKRKSINTKILIAAADQRRIHEAKKTGKRVELQGTPELRKLLKEFRAGLTQRNIQIKSGVKLLKNITFVEGIEEYLFYKPKIKAKTIQTYKYAANIFKEASKDKLIFKYTKKDYIILIQYMNEHNYSEATQAILTRHLIAVWNYFVSKNYCKENIIEKIKTPKGMPNPININDLREILKYYVGKNMPHQLLAVKFLLLTGFRPSSAVAQLWEWIDLEGRVMKVKNVKANRMFMFPIYEALYNLLKAFEQKSGSVLYYKNVDSLNFFARDMKKLYDLGIIRQRYSLYNLRDSFASYLANRNLDISNVQELMDHKDQKITRGHYAQVTLDYLRSKIDSANFEDVLN